MIVNVKMLNGDLISLEMSVYSEQAVCDSLRSDIPNGFIKIHVLNDEEQKDEKNIFVIVLPIHKRGREFQTVLNQLKHYVENMWVENHVEDEDDRKISNTLSYYQQILQLLSGDDAIRGDSYVNNHETALEVFTNLVLDCESDLFDPFLSVNIILDCYHQLCKTTFDVDNVVKRLCDFKHKSVEKSDVVDDYGDFVYMNRLITCTKLLNMINDIHIQR